MDITIPIICGVVDVVVSDIGGVCSVVVYGDAIISVF